MGASYQSKVMKMVNGPPSPTSPQMAGICTYHGPTAGYGSGAYAVKEKPPPWTAALERASSVRVICIVIVFFGRAGGPSVSLVLLFFG